MLKFGNKEFRNLQEQVYKNMHDILFILQEEGVLNEFGIKVVGQESSAANMPTVADYKENNPDWAYGDAYAIGTESPYTLYILTRANGTHPNDYWFNIGSFPVPGPQGPQGPQGEVGPQGPTGNPGANGLDAGFGTISASAETVSPTDPATVTITTSGPNTAKNISFAFEIPQGEKGDDGAGEWGEITGDISNQTDLITALQGKQNTLVSGTNIKTINNESILGSGNIEVAGKPSVADFTAGPGIVIDEDLAHDTVSIKVDQESIPFKVDLSTVAFSGSYNDLSNKPSIPDISNLVTLNTEQTIAAHKTFANPVDFTTSAVKFGAGTVTTIAGNIKNSESNSYGVVIPNTASYTANRTLATTADIPSVSGTNDGTNWTSITINSDTYAIPSGGAGTVTDVTVGGVSVLDGTVAKIPALFDGNYNSLTNKPDLSIYAQTEDLGDCAFLDENEITIDYSQITGKPSIPTKTSDLTNDSGFITGITSSDVTTALGYTPYDSSNPSGFITSAYHDATKQDVISDLATIRSGAALGATAVQPSAIEDMATKTWVGQQGYLTSVTWNDVSGKPTFATVATSGSYNDLSDKPSIPSSTDFIDVTSNQLVDGQKTFIKRSELMDGAIIGYISSGGTYYYPAQITGYNNSLGSNMLDLRTRGNTPAYITLNDFSDGSGPSISLYGNINPVASNKFSLGNSVSKYKDLYLSGNLTDGTNSVSIANIATKSEIPSVPVTDVTLGGVSVLSSGIAVLPAYPTVPTTVSSFTNDAGYITSSALSGYVPTSRTINGNALTSNISLTAGDVGAISSVTPTSETWTFTLDDDSTVTKTVVTAVTSA